MQGRRSSVTQASAPTAAAGEVAAGVSEAPTPAPPRLGSRAERLTPKRRSFVSAGRRGFILRRLLAISDCLALVASWAIVVGLSAALGRNPTLLSELGLFALMLPLWVLVASTSNLYHLSDRRLDHTTADEIGPIAMAVTVWSWVFLLTRAAAVTGPVELLPSIGLWAAAIVTIPAVRSVIRMLARDARWYRQGVVVAGTPADIRRVSRRIARHPELGLELISTIEFDGAVQSEGSPVGMVAESTGDGSSPRRDELLTTIRREVESTSASRVILASSPSDLRQRSELLRALADQRVHVDLVSADSDVMSSRSVLHHIEGLPILTVPAVRSTKASHGVKRGVDLTVAGLGLLVLSPLLAYCAIRIKLDSPGPVFFRQQRVGRDKKPFSMVKFRTMVSDAEALKSELERLNVHRETDTPGMFKVPDDPRITRSGAWLRRWSIDEVPQLWNVLRGDMSLVGPRPLIPAEASLVSGPYEDRFNMRPGITGRWQTLGRSDIGFEDMVKLDYTYAVGWSLTEDIRLLMRTAAVVGNRRGAY
jgi:exopolysaccharide biosynthesis polyprenyl glycosylphosphotransferase